jgi:hypothetical protein
MKEYRGNINKELAVLRAGINSSIGDDDDQQGDDNATISIFFHLT